LQHVFRLDTKPVSLLEKRGRSLLVSRGCPAEATCCRALELATMPSPSMHREHQVVRRVMTVLDMVMALAGAEIVVDGTFKRRSRSHEIALRRV